MTIQTQNPAYRPAPRSPVREATPPPRIWAIADLHLGAAVGKTMDRFGPHWHDHADNIYQNAWEMVAPDDVLLLPGDLSWAMRRNEALPDLEFMASLPGTKIAIKGNHDFWWASKKALDFPGLQSPPVILPGGLGIAGTRGWFAPTPGDEDEMTNRKTLERERERLQKSLAAISDCAVKIVLTHYPPQPFLPELAAAGVQSVAYGHLHLGSLPDDEAQYFDGECIDGVRLFCVAADRVAFTPRRIL